MVNWLNDARPRLTFALIGQAVDHVQHRQDPPARKPKSTCVIDLEEFLRSASPTVDQEPASAGRRAEQPRLLDLDARLDQGVAETFPASDPIAVSPAELRPARLLANETVLPGCSAIWAAAPSPHSR